MQTTKMLAALAACALAHISTAQYPDTCTPGPHNVDCVLPPLSKWFRWKDTRWGYTAPAGRRPACARVHPA